MTKRLEFEWDVFKVTGMREGAIYKTRRVKSVWLPFASTLRKTDRDELAKAHGGDMLELSKGIRMVEA